MVGPISSEERASKMRLLKAAFVLVIGISSGLVTLQGDVSPTVSALAVVLGLLTGVLLVWLVFPGAGEVESTGGRRPPRR